MKKAFTLVELIIVIIIVGILSSVAMGQYAKVVEKSREAEAKNILGTLRKLSLTYYIEHGEYPIFPDEEIMSDSSCASPPYTYWFSYMCFEDGSCKATRCANGGRPPNIPLSQVYCLEITSSGEITRRKINFQ